MERPRLPEATMRRTYRYLQPSAIGRTWLGRREDGAGYLVRWGHSARSSTATSTVGPAGEPGLLADGPHARRRACDGGEGRTLMTAPSPGSAGAFGPLALRGGRPAARERACPSRCPRP